MKKIILTAAAAVVSVWAFAIDITVMTYNIRFGSATEKQPEFEWKNRKVATPLLIADVNPDVFGSQEVEQSQHKFILQNCRDYAGYSIPRQPNEKDPTSTALYWNRMRVKPLKIGVFWFSLTPDVPSKDWGSAHHNQASWGIFKVKETGEKFFVMNIHLDSKSVEARREGVKLARQKLVELNPDNLPWVLFGDFNMKHTTTEITGLDKEMKNARFTAQENLNDDITFHGFGRFSWDNHPEILDHFYWDNFKSCKTYEVWTKSYEGVPYVSDHYPVKVVFEL